MACLKATNPQPISFFPIQSKELMTRAEYRLNFLHRYLIYTPLEKPEQLMYNSLGQ